MTFSIDQTIAVAIQPFLELPQSALCLAESRGKLLEAWGETHFLCMQKKGGKSVSVSGVQMKEA